MEEVGIILHKYPFDPSLEKRAYSLVALVKIPDVRINQTTGEFSDCDSGLLPNKEMEMIWHEAVGDERYLFVQVRPARRAEKLELWWEQIWIGEIAFKKSQKGNRVFLIKKNGSLFHASVKEMIVAVLNIHLDGILCGHMPIVPYGCDLYRKKKAWKKYAYRSHLPKALDNE